MSDKKVIKDLMRNILDFPHIPYWFTVKQAIGIVKKSLLSGDKTHHPMAVLVFDEKYNLVGTLCLKDILKGLEPDFLKAVTKAQVHAEDESGLSALWEDSTEAAEKQVGEIMVPAKIFVQPNDPAAKAAYLMLHNDLVLLPVLEDKKKFVGLVRMIEVFDEISKAIIEG